MEGLAIKTAFTFLPLSRKHHRYESKTMKTSDLEVLESLVRICRGQAERLESMDAVQKSISVKIDRLEIILGQPDRLKDIKKQARADRNREVSELVQEHYHTV